MYKMFIIAFCFLGFTAGAQSQANNDSAIKHAAPYTKSGIDEEIEDPANNSAVQVEDSTTVYYYTDPMPTFPGNLDIYIKDQLTYPEAAKKDKITGNVVVQFLIMRDGSVTNPKVKKNLCEDCDKEAIRLVRNMPQWKPGSKEGRPVIVSYSLNIPFK